MSINDLDTKQTEQNAPEPVQPKEPGTITAPSTDQELAEFFEIEKAEVGKMSPKLNTLLDYAKANTPEGEDVRWTLRRLETKLGTPPFGTDKLSYMAEYAYLWLQSRDMNKKLEKYEFR